MAVHQRLIAPCDDANLVLPEILVATESRPGNGKSPSAGWPAEGSGVPWLRFRGWPMRPSALCTGKGVTGKGVKGLVEAWSELRGRAN
ncbi:Hypothetical protein AA314_02458 [Archangium gephyra]|uniref:Uncharacterized protein n=1 Tax=Archangium gephyra TaxID=48 RepID=A0AAC8Q4Q2_9BACT|nr:Hypothetical protein AA314_02458 [Archangium gephyra]